MSLLTINSLPSDAISPDDIDQEIYFIEPATCCEKTCSVATAIFCGLGCLATGAYSVYNIYNVNAVDQPYLGRVLLAVLSGAASVVLGGVSIYSIKIAKNSFTCTKTYKV